MLRWGKAGLGGLAERLQALEQLQADEVLGANVFDGWRGRRLASI